MEVLHASRPGARMKVMRAAYHSSAGPGLPASSYLVHSSRQVISSGNHFLDSALPPIKPQEVSSTPLDTSQDSEAEKENYKVTEPDDFDISEPSKWKGSSVKSAIRMPSEESSSTDNASIIDLDSLASRRSVHRRSYRDKEKVSSSQKRVSPLLDAPVALSTLKYTSILNGTDEWNNRRKSYSFEDTSPINSSLRGSDSITIDSSTDSGIYKSTDIVDDQKVSTPKEGENTFQDWLFKNRTSKLKNATTHSVSYQPNSVSLKSNGKVTITVPIIIEGERDSSTGSSRNIDENERRCKRVEFCKTELHFAADTGTVNIIATDEKPPPSSDFRKRRSAFVPLNDRFDRSIMLFGDKIGKSEEAKDLIKEINTNVGDIENVENTAATKSILKNKIPKPKPYLLGENMEFGSSQTNNNRDTGSRLTPSAVSLINRQLQSRRYSDDTTSTSISDTNQRASPFSVRTNTTDLVKTNDLVGRLKNIGMFDSSPTGDTNVSPKLKAQSRIQARELKKSELAYFGINNNDDDKVSYKQDNLQEEILHSVKLVQQISNSVSNSEIDSDDAPEYENLPLSSNPLMIPTPKPRSKYRKDVKTLNESRNLKPIPEQDLNSASNGTKCRSKSKKDIRQIDSITNSTTKIQTNESKPIKDINHVPTSRRYQHDSITLNNNVVNPPKCVARKVSPLYVNLNDAKIDKMLCKMPNNSLKKAQVHKSSTKISKTAAENKGSDHETQGNEDNDRKFGTMEKKKLTKPKKDPLKRENSLKQNDKSATSHVQRHKTNDISKNTKPQHTNNDKRPTKIIKHSVTTDVCDIPNIKKQDNIELKISTNKIRYSYNKENKDGARNYDKTNGKSVKRDVDLIKSEVPPKHKFIKLASNDSHSDSRTDSNRKSQRSQYIINYDDKHGTVSSICKIKNGTGSYSRKTVVPNKENQADLKKDNITNKPILQQHRDQQRVTEKPKYKNREKISRVRPHNTCHLL